MEEKLNHVKGLRRLKDTNQKQEKKGKNFEERIEGSFEGIVPVGNIEERGDLIFLSIDADKIEWKKVTEQCFYPSIEELEDIFEGEDNFKIEVSNFK